jgi:hypothetical protein
MMTDGVSRRSATLRVQGLVRKSDSRRRRRRYQCRVVGSKPLSSIRKSLEAAVVYPVSKSSDSSRSTVSPFSRRSRASVGEGLYVSRSLALRRQRPQVRILSGAPITSKT